MSPDQASLLAWQVSGKDETPNDESPVEGRVFETLCLLDGKVSLKGKNLSHKVS